MSVESPLAALLRRLTMEDYINQSKLFDCFPRLRKARKKRYGGSYDIYAMQANPFQGPINPSGFQHLWSLVAFRVIKVSRSWLQKR